jgi:alanine racemase
MIYSRGFSGLPKYAHEYVYHRLADILSGRDQSAPYSHIAAADRATTLQILTQTNPEFAAFAQTLNAQNVSAANSSPTG